MAAEMPLTDEQLGRLAYHLEGCERPEDRVALQIIRDLLRSRSDLADLRAREQKQHELLEAAARKIYDAEEQLARAREALEAVLPVIDSVDRALEGWNGPGSRSPLGPMLRAALSPAPPAAPEPERVEGWACPECGNVCTRCPAPEPHAAAPDKRCETCRHSLIRNGVGVSCELSPVECLGAPVGGTPFRFPYKLWEPAPEPHAAESKA